MSQVGSPKYSEKLAKKRVWAETVTAIKKGYAFCYNYDYGTAASVDIGRAARVEIPSSTNLHNFAGVAVQDYAANAMGQSIEIIEPDGHVCDVYSDQNCTLGTTILAIRPASHKLTAPLYGGTSASCRVVALALQTVNRSDTNGRVMAKLDANAFGITQGVGISSDAGAHAGKRLSFTCTDKCVPNNICLIKFGATGEVQGLQMKIEAAPVTSGLAAGHVTALYVVGSLGQGAASCTGDIIGAWIVARVNAGDATSNTVLTTAKSLIGVLAKAEALDTLTTVTGNVYPLWVAGGLNSAVGGTYAMMYFQYTSTAAITPDYWFEANAAEAVALVSCTDTPILGMKVKIGSDTRYVMVSEAAA